MDQNKKSLLAAHLATLLFGISGIFGKSAGAAFPHHHAGARFLFLFGAVFYPAHGT